MAIDTNPISKKLIVRLVKDAGPPAKYVTTAIPYIKEAASNDDLYAVALAYGQLQNKAMHNFELATVVEFVEV